MSGTRNHGNAAGEAVFAKARHFGNYRLQTQQTNEQRNMMFRRTTAR
jgi:hypothetical protein